MRKSNFVYLIFHTFTADLLFWIVIDNLFLSTVKGFSAFQIVLVTLLGLVFSLLLYPLTNYIVKKTSNKTSIILAALCYVIAISLFMVCDNIIGFIVGQTFYSLSSPFKTVSSVMLKNNLKEQGKSEEFVKWKSYGKLSYATITLIVSIIAGFLFNVNAYLPLVLSLCCALIGLIFSFIYQDSNVKEENDKIQEETKTPLYKNRIMFLIMLMNIIAVGTYIFLQQKATLLIQYVLEDVQIDIAKISIIISGIVFGSRLCRVISNLIYPKIYKTINNKHKIVLVISLLILSSNLLFAIGANLNINYIVKLILITIGFYIILSVRDLYAVTEDEIIRKSIPANQQKQAYVLANIYGKFGRLASNAFALVILGFMPLNVVYALMLVLAVGQIFICIPLSNNFKIKNEIRTYGGNINE